MENFTYTDIFDTKGIEYLIIIAFLLLLIPLWIWMNKPLAEKKKSRVSFSLRNISFPEGLFLSKYHTWAFLGKSGMAKIGVDDLLLHLTGTVRIQALKPEGAQVQQGEAVARLIKNGKKLEILSPVSGQVGDINRNVLMHEGTINSNPYEEGWIYRIKPSHWQEETSLCYLGNNAITWLKAEINQIRDFLLKTGAGNDELQPAVLQEGGEISEEVLASMSYEVWEDFEKMFLKR